MPNTKSRDLRFYKHEPEISEVVSDDELYDQQVCLYKGLDKNPDKNIYGGIIALSPKRKAALQERLRDITTKQPSPMIYPYNLCIHLKGLTYYELFKNAIEFIYLNPDLDASEKKSYKEGYEFLMEVVDSFSLPSAVSAIEMTPKVYNRLSFLARNLTAIYFYDAQKYEFLRQPLLSPYYAMKRFEAEVKTASDSVINLAKQLINGKDNDNEIDEGIALRI